MYYPRRSERQAIWQEPDSVLLVVGAQERGKGLAKLDDGFVTLRDTNTGLLVEETELHGTDTHRTLLKQ